MTLHEDLTKWLKEQHGTAGWQMKLERFIESRHNIPYDIDEWLRVGRERNYLDYYLSTLGVETLDDGKGNKRLCCSTCQEPLTK